MAFKVHAHPGERSPVSSVIYPPLQSFSDPLLRILIWRSGESRNLWTPEMMGLGLIAKGEMEEKGAGMEVKARLLFS